MLAHQDGEDRTGPPSCRTTPKTSGRVISCRSQTSSFAHCLPSSFSICTLVKSSMWVSHDLLPMPGLHNNCGRRLPMDNRRNISFAIVITNLDPVSLAWPQPAASRCSLRLTTHLEPMRSVNGFWAACVESVSITFSSSRRSNCIVSCVPISSTSIKPDRIKASNNRSQNSMVNLSLQITMVARSSPSQSWVACTTITAEALDLCHDCEEADGSVGWSALHLGSRIPSVSFYRFSQMNATSKRYFSFLRSESYFMTSLYSPEKHQSRRLLKRSNPPFFRQMLQVASTPLSASSPRLQRSRP